MAGDLKAKRVEWNSRLSTLRGKLLRDYAAENSCLIFGPDTQTQTLQPLRYPDVLDIVTTKNLTSRFSDFLLGTKLGTPPGTH
jgi:hypothetical protein